MHDFFDGTVVFDVNKRSMRNNNDIKACINKLTESGKSVNMPQSLVELDGRSDMPKERGRKRENICNQRSGQVSRGGAARNRSVQGGRRETRVFRVRSVVPRAGHITRPRIIRDARVRKKRGKNKEKNKKKTKKEERKIKA